MKKIYEKLFTAKYLVSQMNTKKQGKNTFSKYDYFTPEQVNTIVQLVCEQEKLLTLFHLKRNELGEYGVLEVIDIESGEKLEVEASTAIPEIKATNVAQQIGGCMTYTERYLKMTTFGIADNALDFDTTENTEKRAKSEGKRFNDAEYAKLEAVKETYKTGEEAIKAIKTKYQISNIMETKVLSLYAI